MRYAVIDTNNFVDNISMGLVPGLECVPCDNTVQIGYSWNGTEFLPPAPEPWEPPSTSEVSQAVYASWQASCRRKAALLQDKGNTAGATALLLKAAGIQTK